MAEQSGSSIRRSFLDFFAERGHRIVPSAPVYPLDDPTLLFTNAGMNQFKDVFLGTGTRDYSRAADTQKCLRVSGKHNDLDEVGRDTYHHTFFEMLGSWSFGDYFKEEAIRWAWEYLTGVCGLSKDRMWATYFGGDERTGLPPDEETRDLWARVTDIDPSRILSFGAKDNFWEMGATGPCGPCSEIHVDQGDEGEDREDGRDPRIGVNAGNARFMEVWNLVFIQFNRVEDGSLKRLPQTHVDTGMSLERLTALSNGIRSNYDTDLFRPVIERAEELCGLRYGGGEAEADVAFRVVADHARALSVALADGVLPGNVGRGYVLRRILRRAARFGRKALGMEGTFLHRLAPAVAEIFDGVFPEVRERLDHVQLVLESEEQAFLETLDKGLAVFAGLTERVRRSGRTELPGDKAYDLYATYGFPADLVEVMAAESGMSVDHEGWRAAEEAHRAASAGGGGGKELVSAAELEGLPPTRSLYHDEDPGRRLCASARPLRLIGERVLVLDRTPFYAEAGGQVGDRGTIVGPGFRFEVEDTKRSGQLTLHVGRLVEGGDPLPETVTASVTAGRRSSVRANHTATHLLHWSLRKVLGTHVTQQGSYVGDDRLRFDFTHPRALATEELEEVERLVNEEIAANHALVTTVEDLAEARGRGVTALFGEKYDDRVRVVDVGGFSLELCGGTHVDATGQIGPFVVSSESAIQAGVRRIEALTGGAALAWLQGQRRALRAAAKSLRVAEGEVPARVEGLLDNLKELKKGKPKQTKTDLRETARTLLAEATRAGGALVVARRIEGFAGAELSKLIAVLRGGREPVCGVLGLAEEGKAALAVFASDQLAERGLDASEVIARIAERIDGRGGGSASLARAGGKGVEGLDAAVAEGAELLRAGLGGG